MSANLFVFEHFLSETKINASTSDINSRDTEGCLFILRNDVCLFSGIPGNRKCAESEKEGIKSYTRITEVA